MKVLSIFTLTVISTLIISCGESETASKKEETASVGSEITYASFGDSITAENTLTGEEMLAKYQTLNEGDTINVKFAGIIEQVCQTKGCWMSVLLSEEEDSYVRFKDYGFFMPFNAAESEAIVNGKAFVSVTSVEKLKETATEEGLSDEEIAAITEPKVDYHFEADGVLIKE